MTIRKCYSTVLSVVLVMGLFTLSTGCGKGGTPPNPQTIKILLQTAAVAFEAAMVAENPAGWNGPKFNADINNTINAWQVGATWQQNVINLLGPVSADISLITGCSAKCQNLISIFTGAVQTVIADLQTQQPGTKANLRVKPEYDSWAAYRQDWNREAPSTAQLPTLEDLGL